MPKGTWKSPFYHTAEPITIGDTTIVYAIDAVSASVTCRGRTLNMTVAEAMVLERLGKKIGAVIAVEGLLPEARAGQAEDPKSMRRLIRVYLTKVRATLQELGSALDIRRVPDGLKIDDTRV